MTDAITFLGEINFQAARSASSEIEIDVERFFVNYRIDPRFNLQGGLYFTPIGVNNRFLYASAWLMNSIRVPDFFEEELNLFPTHSVGVGVNGEFEVGNGPRVRRVSRERPGASAGHDHPRARSPGQQGRDGWLNGSSQGARTAAAAGSATSTQYALEPSATWSTRRAPRRSPSPSAVSTST